jgi:hypothetical protein
MILIKNIPFKKIAGIALYPFVLVSHQKPSRELINHEKIHLRQQAEMLVIPFYIWYVLEWFFLLFKYRSWWKAYRRISFEEEAYAHEDNLNYLSERKFWAFLKYF